MRRHRCRPHVYGNAGNTLFQAGPDADNMVPVTKRHRHLPFASPQHRLHRLQDIQITAYRAGHTIRPLCLQRLYQTAEITRGFVHIGLAHLDKAQAHNRVHLDLPVICRLAHKLIVHLTFGRNIDDHVAT